MKYRNKAHNPGMEFTLPNGMRIVAYMSGKAEPSRHDADWSGICVAMVAPNGDMLPLCSTEYVERDHKVRVFGHNGRINELDVSIDTELLGCSVCALDITVTIADDRRNQGR